jgi:hypothetical protein
MRPRVTDCFLSRCSNRDVTTARGQPHFLAAFAFCMALIEIALSVRDAEGISKDSAIAGVNKRCKQKT